MSVSSQIDPFEWPQKELNEENWYVDDDLFRFTSHMPDTMVAVEPGVVWDHWNSPYGVTAHAYFEVYDTNGSEMPSLWVEERFSFITPPDPPAYHWGNPSQNPFEKPGRIYSDSFPTTQFIDTGFRTNWLINWPTSSVDSVWTTSPPPAEDDERAAWEGIFGPDIFEIRITSGWPYSDGLNPPVYDFMHHYFAATRNAHPNGTTGIPIGTYRLRMWTDLVLHEKQ